MADGSNAESGKQRTRITTIFRDHSEVVWERLDEQHQRVMEVAESIEAARDAWDRSGLVCGVEVGKQVDATEAAKQMESLLKAAAETLIDIANKIRPPGVWQTLKRIAL
jgi:UV DNA damage repair endonuclease